MILAIRKSINVLLPSLTCLCPKTFHEKVQNLTHTLKTPQKRVCSKQEVRPPPSLMGGVGVSVYFFLCMCTETWNPGDYREPRAPQIQVSFSMTIEAHSILNQTPHLWFLTHGAAVTISLQCTTKHDNQTLHWLQMDYECTIKIKTKPPF